MFGERDESMLRTIVRLLKPQVLLQGDFAFRKNEPGTVMYFIQMGRVQIGSEDFSTVYTVCRPGSYFGELAMFTNSRRNASARALQDGILYTLHRVDFMTMCESYPGTYEQMYLKAKEQIAVLDQRNRQKVATTQLASSFIDNVQRRSFIASLKQAAAAPMAAGPSTGTSTGTAGQAFCANARFSAPARSTMSPARFGRLSLRSSQHEVPVLEIQRQQAAGVGRAGGPVAGSPSETPLRT